MNSVNILFFINGAILTLIIGLIFYQIDTRWNPFGKLKCKIGIHRRVCKRLNKRVKTYHCVVCSKTKKHPDLKVVDGGKKDPSIIFKR